MAKSTFYWIKLRTDFFLRPEIDYILSNEKDGCKYIVLYQMLCLNTANSNGILIEKINDLIIPYDINKIVRDTKFFNEETVISALNLYKKLGLIFVQDDSTMKISDFDNMVGFETKWAEQKRKYRKKGQCPNEDDGQLNGQNEDNVQNDNRTNLGQEKDNVLFDSDFVSKCNKNGQNIGQNEDNVLKNVQDNVRQEIEIRDKRLENRYKSIDIRNNNKINNFKNKEILPYWMEHPEICKAIPTTDEDRKELEELLKEFKS